MLCINLPIYGISALSVGYSVPLRHKEAKERQERSELHDNYLAGLLVNVIN